MNGEEVYVPTKGRATRASKRRLRSGAAKVDAREQRRQAGEAAPYPFYPHRPCPGRPYTDRHCDLSVIGIVSCESYWGCHGARLSIQVRVVSASSS